MPCCSEHPQCEEQPHQSNEWKPSIVLCKRRGAESELGWVPSVQKPAWDGWDRILAYSATSWPPLKMRFLAVWVGLKKTLRLKEDIDSERRRAARKILAVKVRRFHLKWQRRLSRKERNRDVVRQW